MCWDRICFALNTSEELLKYKWQPLNKQSSALKESRKGVLGHCCIILVLIQFNTTAHKQEVLISLRKGEKQQIIFIFT